MDKKSFVLYTEYIDAIKALSDEQCGLLFRAILASQSGREMPILDPVTGMAFSFIKNDLDKNAAKYEATRKQRSEAGKKGAAAKKASANVASQSITNQANANFAKQEMTNQAIDDFAEQEMANQTDNANVYDNDNDNDSVHTLNDVQDECISVFNAYNSICTRLNRAEKMTNTRREAIKTLLQDYTEDDVKNAFSKANKSDFLSGRATGGFQAGIDFVLQPDKFLKILEGVYDNHKSKANQGLYEQNYDFDEIEKILLSKP